MSDAYKALAHPVRRKILAMLRVRAHSAGDLADAFDLAKPSLTGHFNVLKSAGLVTTERRGATIIYHLNLSVLEDAMAGLMDLFQIGAPQSPPDPPALSGADGRATCSSLV